MKKTTLIIIFIPIIAIISILLISLFFYMIIKIIDNTPEGEEAIKVMTPEEKEFLETKLKIINQDTDLEILIELLGEPYRYYPEINKQTQIRWINLNNDNFSIINIRFKNNQITKIQYSVISRFRYEIILE